MLASLAVFGHLGHCSDPLTPHEFASAKHGQTSWLVPRAVPLGINAALLAFRQVEHALSRLRAPQAEDGGRGGRVRPDLNATWQFSAVALVAVLPRTSPPAPADLLAPLDRRRGCKERPGLRDEHNQYLVIIS